MKRTIKRIGETAAILVFSVPAAALVGVVVIYLVVEDLREAWADD